MRSYPALALLLCTLGSACHAAPRKAPPPAKPPRIEVSLSGYQSVIQPERKADRLNYEYVLPSDETLAYFKRNGITVFRLPMLWERVQPVASGPLDAAKIAELTTYLKHADTLGVKFIPDLHAFGRRDGDKVLGSKELPASALVSFWSQFAAAFKGRFAGYDIMNEPHDMPSKDAWPKMAQATVDAIRKVDTVTPIYVEGDDWSNAERWPVSNATLSIRDPSRKIIYSAHQYFDRDTSGQYKKSYADDGVDPGIGARRIQPFVKWLRAHKAKGHLGEFGIPIKDPKWLPVMDQFLAQTSSSRDVLTGATYWMAGDWAEGYDLTLQPAKSANWADRPQMKILVKKR